MRVSCNGCRVLRKGCSDDCTLRPCLTWIKSSDAQAHATLFLAKFYGRAGLLNLINAGPDHVRPAIFKSLLYEACGRIVNPIHGSLGLLWCGKWDQCEAAVDAVLKGLPISSQFMPPQDVPALLPCDIRHVPKTAESHSAVRTRSKAKRPAEASHDDLVHSEENKCVQVGKRPNVLNDGEVGLELSIGLPGVFSIPEDAN